MAAGTSVIAASVSVWLKMSKPTDRFWDLLYPTRCIFCRNFLPPGRPGVCPVCEAALPWIPEGGHRRGNFFSECVSVLRYEDDVKSAIHRYKFNGVQAYAPVFGEMLASCIYENLESGYDILSWVPLDPVRRHGRGYDQAELITREAGRRLCREPVPVLKKRWGRKAQSKTGDPASRKANIAGAYRASDPALIAGKRILLIDDIVTTGATLSECAKTLLLAGAEDVCCATLASTQ